jgi:hypothetical protein
MHDLNKTRVNNENTMRGYTFLIFLFILLYSSEEERTAVLVRKTETGASVQEREANTVEKAELLESLKPKRNKFLEC